MTNLKKIIRKNIVMTNVIIALIGIVCILLVLVVKDQNGKDILLGVGTSFLSSALIVFITTAFMEDTENEQILKMWGAEAIYSTRQQMNVSCDYYMEKAKRIDIIAFGLRSLRDSKGKTVENLLKSGCRIRIITMKPHCDNLRQREKDELQLEGSISNSIQQLTDWARRVNARNYSGRIEIKYYDAHPLDFLYLMDNRLFTGPYEYGKGSQQSISYEFNTEGEAYKYYSEYFNDLWNDNIFTQKEV